MFRLSNTATAHVALGLLGLTGIIEPVRARTNTNIVVFFADNLGWGDIFGAPSTRTTALDSLSRDGVRLLNWNSAAHVCSPSRASLLTGRLMVRTGVYPMTFRADSVFGLPSNETTLAEHLQRAGWATMAVGKWHLGQQEQYLPTSRGFENYLGIPYSMDMGSVESNVCGDDVNRTHWLPLFANATIVEQPVDPTQIAPRYAEAAAGFVRSAAASRRPFFLYLPFSHLHQLCAPHSGQWASLVFANRSGAGPVVDAVEEVTPTGHFSVELCYD